MANHLVSSFDVNYLPRALVLYETARKSIPDCKFWYLCLDDKTKHLLGKLNLKDLTAFTVDELNRPELAALRATRTRAEFAFTSKSNFMAYLVDSGKISDSDNLLFADADVMFFASAVPFIQNMMSRHPVIRTPHRFAPKDEHTSTQVGRYNAGMVFYRVGPEAREAIHGWAKKCIEWCFHRLEDGKFADQMYIDAWHNEYKGVYDLPDKGINLGTWNILRYKIARDTSGGFTIDGEPLVCFHFHGFKMFLDRNGKVRPLPITIYNPAVYADYLAELQKAYDRVRAIEPGFSGGLTEHPGQLKVLKQLAQRAIRNHFTQKTR